MLSHPRTLSPREYIIRWNQFVEKFIVFEAVFSEYAQTSKNIILGKCLVDENLQSLQRYFQANLGQLYRFKRQVNEILPPAGFTETNQALQAALQNYVQATEAMSDALGESDEARAYQRVCDCRQQQTNQREQINAILNDISAVTF